MAASYGTVRLSLDELVAERVIEPDLAQRLARLGKPSGFNGPLVGVLYILGALAVAAGVIALKPTATTGLVLAVAALGGAWIADRWQDDGARILSLGLAISGALGLGGWFAMEFGQTLPNVAVTGVATLVVLCVAIAFRSLFLAALVPLGIGAMVGSGTAYWHASYAIFVREPTITFLLFAVLAAALVWIVDRRRVRGAYAAMAEVAMRVSVVVSNFGLWVGSLWGDRIGEHLSGIRERLPDEGWSERNRRIEAWRETAFEVPEAVFTLGWVGVAVAMILVGQRIERRFVTIAGVVFLVINAYTQFFERFHAEAWALIVGGVSLVAVAITLVRWGKRL